MRLNPDGTPDPFFSFDAIIGASCTAVQADGQIVIGGYGMARLNADGTLDVGFNPDPKVLYVGSIGMQADGKILIAGSLNGTNSIARLNADGSLDASFNPNPGQSVRCMAVQADGKILIWGSLNGTNCIARLNVNGTLDTGFNFTAGISGGSVWSIAIQADGKVIIGGDFTSVGGAARNHLARLNADGTLDIGFNPNIGRVSRLPGAVAVGNTVVQTDGKIIIQGSFNVGATRVGLARLNADGSLDAGFNPDQGISTSSIAIQTDGKVLICGYFTNVAGMARDHVVRLLNDDAIQKLAVPSASRIEWLRGGASPEVQSVVFELSTNRGTTWNALGVGTRIAGGWELTGLSLPASGLVRGRAGVVCGQNNGSSGLVEAVAAFPPNAPPVVANPIADLTVNEDAPNTVIDLRTVFQDAETADAELIYSIQGNTSPWLASATIDNTTDVVTLHYQTNQFGTATITVRATDAVGLYAEDTFHITPSGRKVRVSPLSAPSPMITSASFSPLSPPRRGADSDGRYGARSARHRRFAHLV